MDQGLACERCGKEITPLDLKVGDAVVRGGDICCARCAPRRPPRSPAVWAFLLLILYVPLLALLLVVHQRMSGMEAEAARAAGLTEDLKARHEEGARGLAEARRTLSEEKAAFEKRLEEGELRLQDLEARAEALDRFAQFLAQSRPAAAETTAEDRPLRPDPSAGAPQGAAPAADPNDPSAPSPLAPAALPPLAAAPPSPLDPVAPRPIDPAAPSPEIANPGHLSLLESLQEEGPPATEPHRPPDPPAPLSPAPPASSPDPGLLQERIAALKDQDPAVRFAAARALSLEAPPEAAGPLAEALADESPLVRALAARGLGKVGSRETAPALLRALSDTDLYVRHSAYEALKKVTGEGLPFHADAEPPSREAEAEGWRRKILNPDP